MILQLATYLLYIVDRQRDIYVCIAMLSMQYAVVYFILPGVVVFGVDLRQFNIISWQTR